MRKDYQLKRKVVEINTATSKSEDEWDVEAFFIVDYKELAFMATSFNQIDHKNDWIINPSCSTM